MRLAPIALPIIASVGLGAATHAATAVRKQAWFYQDNDTNRWCSVVTETSAKAIAASSDERFDFHETGWLHYHRGVIDDVMITNQSEDAYEEDTYEFAPDFSVKELVRKGHYQTDPFLTVTFKPNAHGRLVMTAQSKRRVKSWQYFHYFEDWPLYKSFGEMPFARLIHMKPHLTITGYCSGVH